MFKILWQPVNLILYLFSSRLVTIYNIITLHKSMFLFFLCDRSSLIFSFRNSDFLFKCLLACRLSYSHYPYLFGLEPVSIAFRPIFVSEIILRTFVKCLKNDHKIKFRVSVSNTASHKRICIAKLSQCLCSYYLNRYCYINHNINLLRWHCMRSAKGDLALSNSGMFNHNPTSHCCTNVWQNNSLLRLISYVTHSLYKNTIFWKAGEDDNHLIVRYFSASSLQSQILLYIQNAYLAYRLPTA
jgi:hypothetical protein